MKKVGRVFGYIVLAIGAFLSLFPFYFMFVSGTNTNAQILSVPPKLTIGTELAKNFAILSGKIDLLQSTWNTLFISVVYTVLALLLFSAAGYALAKFEFKGKKIIYGFVMGSMMIASLVMYVPLFEMMIKLNLTDSYWAVILPLLANAFGIFLMRQNMLAFPTALMEAGRIDGVGEIGIFFKIVLPNIKPALGALVIYMFTSMWNNFMWPLIILGSEDKYTLPIALAMLDGNPTNKNYAVILLATAVATLPILIIFLIFQKQFVRGLTTAAGMWATAGIGMAVGGGMYWLGVSATVLTLAGLELLTVLFKNLGLRTMLVHFTTTRQENLVRILDQVHQRRYRVVSYKAAEEKHGELCSYRVSLVVKIKEQREEQALFTFIQSLPDLVLTEME